MSARSISAVMAGVLSLLVAGCGAEEDLDTVPQGLLQLLNDTTDALKEIKDEETALAATAKLRTLGERKVKLDEQAKATKVSQAGIDKSDAKYAQPMKEAGEKLRAEMTRIAEASPKAAEIAATALGMR